MAGEPHITAEGQVGLVEVPFEQMLPDAFARAQIVLASNPRLGPCSVGALSRRQPPERIHLVEPVEQSEPQQGPVPLPRGWPERWIERIARFVGNEPGRMGTRPHRRPELLKRRKHLAHLPGNHFGPRFRVEARLGAGRARIVEQEERRIHRLPFARSGPTS